MRRGGGQPIPAGATITAATMTLNMVSGTSTANNADAYQVTGGEWTSASLQWSNKPAANIRLEENISHNNKTKYQFSCLAAVQHWYDGDTTGQHENYGIMLCYNNPDIADYNSVYSADCTDATLRPSLTITYDPLRISIQEGVSVTLTAPTTGVTWTSSNTEVATVTSAGRLTGIKAGNTTVTATKDGAIVKVYNVCVTIVEGVYYIKNTSLGLYLCTTGGVAEQTWTTLKHKATSEFSQLQQLWKIDYLGNDKYSIRPLYVMSMGLHAISNAVDIVTIGSTDSLSAVPLSGCWGIEGFAGGYELTHTGSSSLVMGVYVSNSEYHVTTGNYINGNSASYWTFERVTSVTNQVLLLDANNGWSAANSTRYVAPGEVATLDDIGIKASFVDMYSIDQSIKWSVLDASVASVDSATGAITGLTAGETTVVLAQHIRNGVTFEKQYSICVTDVPEGTYLIRNKTTEKCVDIQNGSMSNGNPVVHWDISGDDSQKWIFTHLGDGNYSIRSANSGAPYYLGVSGDSTADGQPVVLRTGLLTNGMKWKINYEQGLGYEFIPLTGLAEGYVLDVGPSGYNQINGDILKQNEYAHHGWWNLFMEKDYTLMYIGNYNGDSKMPPILNSVENALKNGAQMVGFGSTSMAERTVLDGHLVTSELFSCITHGAQTYIKLNSETYRIEDLDKIPNLAFDDLKLAYLGACDTAKSEDGERCFAQTLYDKGVDTVIGYEGNADINATNYWAEKFMVYLAEGYTIEQAIDLADAALRTGSGLTDLKMQSVLEENRFIAGPIDVVICEN